MIMTKRKSYRDGDLRVGWASWDEGAYTARSIKYAYQDKTGKISRGAPELPFDILMDMLIFAADEGELDAYLPLAKEAYEKLGTIIERYKKTVA